MRYLSFIAILFIAQSALAQADKDTNIVVVDTLKEVEINGQKELPVVDAIRKSMGGGLTMPKKKGISDYINTDKILHPFAGKQRRREKNKKMTQKYLEEYDRVKSFEEQLTEAIQAQMREDSIAALKNR